MTNEISSKYNARRGNGRDKNLAIARILGAPRQPSATPLSRRRPVSPPFAVAASPTTKSSMPVGYDSWSGTGLDRTIAVRYEFDRTYAS